MKFAVVSLLLAILMPLNGYAALRSANRPAEVDPKAAFNPREDPQDIILPMPGGLEMVLRAVELSASDPLSDRKFDMGLRSPDENRGYSESPIPGHVSAPFRRENLPASWQAALEASDGTNDDSAYYFLGKYELTNGQWDAVMGENSGERPDLPKTGISWYDLQDFLRKYNEWLLANHPDQIPVIEGTPAFLRLPSEAEWEFAARGGNLPTEQMDGIDNPYGDAIADYAIFGNRFDNPQPVGSRKPNNLGIYDLAGNVAELVGDSFRFTVTERGDNGGTVTRLHGSQGGLLSKGGSFLAATPDQVFPGRRDETRMFVKAGDGSFAPFRDRSTGARLLLGTLNVPGAKREKDILDRIKDLTSTQAPIQTEAPARSQASSAVVIDRNGDPLVELEKIYAATDSPEMKKNLEQLRSVLRGSNEAFARERTENLLNRLRSATYMADSLANIAFRCFEADSTRQMVKTEPGYTKEIDKQFRDQIAQHFRNLLISTNMYRVNVRDLASYPKKDIDSLLKELRKQYSGKDRVNANFRHQLDALGDHIALVGSKGMGALKDETIWEQVIPGKRTIELLKQLNKSKK